MLFIYFSWHICAVLNRLFICTIRYRCLRVYYTTSRSLCPPTNFLFWSCLSIRSFKVNTVKILNDMHISEFQIFYIENWSEVAKPLFYFTKAMVINENNYIVEYHFFLINMISSKRNTFALDYTVEEASKICIDCFHNQSLFNKIYTQRYA